MGFDGGIADCMMLENQVLGLADLISYFIVYTGGWRSGKTVFLVAKALDLGLRNWPAPVLYVAPTFRLLEDVFVKEAEQMMARWGFEAEWVVSKKRVYLHTSDRRIEVICRSAENPDSIEGVTVGASIIDEWESCLLRAVKIAVARRSMKVPVPQIVLGGVPKGFGPHYQWLRRRKRGVNTITSSALDNHHIDEDFVDETAAGLSNEEIQQNILGKRAMPADRVYTRFNNALHTRPDRWAITNPQSRHVDLEMWCDFNVDPMAWGFFLVDKERKLFHCVGELVVKGTESERQSAEATQWIRAFYAKHNMPAGDDCHRGTLAVCDANAPARSGITPISHTMNLHRAGFTPVNGAKNPFVDDRIMSVQRALGGPNPLGGSWPTHLTFDEDAAPYITSCIASQPRNEDGSPNKDAKVGLDHGADLVGYGVMFHWPIDAPAPGGRRAA